MRGRPLFKGGTLCDTLVQGAHVVVIGVLGHVGEQVGHLCCPWDRQGSPLLVSHLHIPARKIDGCCEAQLEKTLVFFSMRQS